MSLPPAQAAPLSREDTASTDAGSTADDAPDAGTASANPGTASPTNAALVAAATAIPGAKPASSPGTASLPAPAAVERDFGRSIREVSKPVLEELAHSDVADAVRALDTKGSAVDTALVDGNQAADSGDPGVRKRNWDGTGQQQARENNLQMQNAPRDQERDKARAALLLSGLINEIKPWALGAVVLYVLAQIAKFSLAARRRTVQRRAERRRYHRRTTGDPNSQHSQNSQHGRP
ncbi:hypothetical protein RD110_25300 [Rhodoferax koreense]|uniref:Uncharacterized protein n=1 Tax=Rhodoferax koreensis TaxID=1842727 RepID=A0A1P8K268_9BURK|nr:hypothetical protein [Rhodoferax koreense]APW40112.1 hypothetical protein RD110_25300 [Rhodoferax koreense]